MKSVSEFKILNNASVDPFLSMDYELMQQIQHIVEIAPKEAQWFHLLEQISETEFRLSDMFIPEQVCSSVEVDTDSEMMIKFWNELKEKYGVVEASNKLTKMTVWCHSHHNMAPNPSGQDNRQFLELVKQQKDAGTNRPVLMLIFNKKDQYYSRIWDPQTNLTYEGLDIVYTQYDMSWIDKEAKLKFKEPVVKNYISSSFGTGTKTTYWGATSSKPSTKQTLTNNYLGSFEYDYNVSKTPNASSCADNHIQSCFGLGCNSLNIITQPMAETFADYVYEELETQELYILANLLRKETNFYQRTLDLKIKKSNKKQYKETLIKCLNQDRYDIGFAEMLLTTTFEMYDQLLIKDKENFDTWTNDFIESMSEYSTKPQQYSFYLGDK